MIPRNYEVLLGVTVHCGYIRKWPYFQEMHTHEVWRKGNPPTLLMGM